MTINRRRFLKTSAAGLVAVNSGAFLTGCGRGLTRTDLVKNEQDVETSPLLTEKTNRILQYASLAPSGHNSQPWLVTVKKKREWLIQADPGRRLPAVDPQNRELLLSIGAFVENLEIAARAMGYGIETDVLARNPRYQNILRVMLYSGTATDYPLQRITSRMTVKSGFRKDEIKSDDVKALKEAAGGYLHYFPQSSSHGQCIREGAVENFRIQLTRDDAQREMAEWVRLDKKTAMKYRDGLTVEGMEIGGLAGWFVRNFSSPKDFLKESFKKRTLDKVAKQASEGGGWFVITSPGNSVADLIDTGRRFERMALLARERNIAIHPMTQTLEESHGKKQIAENHEASMIPQFVLRVGYLSKYPAPVSLRRPVKWFVRS